MAPTAEIDVLDQEVLGQDEGASARRDKGGVIADAPQDSLPADGEHRADEGDEPAFAQI